MMLMQEYMRGYTLNGLRGKNDYGTGNFEIYQLSA